MHQYYNKLENENSNAYKKLEELIVGYIDEWQKIAPHSLEEAVELGQMCGESCFLRPDTGDYPVCPKCGEGGCYCMPVCSGLFNANRLGTARNDNYVVDAAIQLAFELGCDWALIMYSYLLYKYPKTLKLMKKFD